MEKVVSIVLAVYNGEKTIREAIESVLFQSYRNWELIIVDDGSIDKTSEIIKGYKDERIKYIFQENQGRSKARNKGIFLSKGDYIAFLDSDDIWLKEHLKREIEIFHTYPEIALVYSDIEIIDENGKRMQFEIQWKPKRYSGLPINQLIEENFIPFSTVIIKKRILDKVGFFDISIDGAEDWDLWLRIVKEGYKIYYLDEITVKYRWKTTNWSKAYQKKMAEEGIKTLIKFYKIYPLKRNNLKFWIKSYLTRINTLLSFVYKKPFSKEIKKYFKEYPLPLITLISYSLFWKILLKWILGDKIIFIKNFLKKIKWYIL